MQSGVVSGSLARYLCSGRGVLDTLPYLAPYVLVSAPHDFAELMTIGACSRAARAHLAHVGLPPEVTDAVGGACAGVAGVLISAPMDLVLRKCVTATSAAQFGRPDLAWPALGMRAKWMLAARFTWQTQGLRGLFVGVVPRLIDEVPGAMLHWVFVEATLRALP